MLNTSTSIIDAVKSKGLDSSFAGRSALYAKYGKTGYVGSASQNQELIQLVNSGASTGTSKTGSIVTNSATAQSTNNNNIATLNNVNASYQGANGVDQNVAGSTQQTTNTSGASNTNGMEELNRTVTDSMKQMQTEQTDYLNKIKEGYATLKTNNDALYNKTIDGINSRFDSLRTQLTDLNSRYTAKTTQNQYAINGFRYTPQQAEGMIYQAESAGISKLQDLENERATAIMKANEAKQNDDTRALNDSMTLIQKNFDNRMKVIQEMQDYAKKISDQITASQKAQASTFTSMYKDIDQIVPFYNSMGTTEQKEKFVQEYAKRTGADPEMVRSTLGNYTKSQLAYKTGTSVTANKTSTAKTTATKTAKSSSGSKATPVPTATVSNEIPDTPSKRKKEMEADIKILMSAQPNIFDQNGYLVPEAVSGVIKQYVAQGYPEAEVKKVLDGYIYDEQDDSWLEKAGTKYFNIKR